MSEEKCQRCGELGLDRRTLTMGCRYEMIELGIPFLLNEAYPYYCLRVCKDCRGAWMKAIKEWFENPEPLESCGSGIYVRENGTNVEISQEEWDRRQAE